MIDLDALNAHLEVQVNILNEQKAERERYEQGVRAMQTSQGLDVKDFAPQGEVKIVIDRFQEHKPNYNSLYIAGMLGLRK